MSPSTAYKKYTIWSARLTIWTIALGITGLFGAALMDVTLHLRWGFSWADVLASGGMLLFVCVLYIVVRAFFRIIGFGSL